VVAGVCVSMCASVCVYKLINKGRKGLFEAKASNEADAGRDRATPASVRHDDDQPLTPISQFYRSIRDLELEQKRPTSAPVGAPRAP
jgi:hypothetical protein